MSRSAQAQATAYRAGWALVGKLPARASYAWADRAADLVVKRAGKGVCRLRSNYRRILPDLADAELDALVRAGMRSYLRYYVDAFRLPGLGREQILGSVRAINDGPVRADLEHGNGVVIALAHQGNWDLAGAWATLSLGQVTTVAERLEPPEAFEAFLLFRQALGMEILALGDDRVFSTLVHRIKVGNLVPLLIDRDLSKRGIEVDLAGNPARMAAGPAMLADLADVHLYPTSIYYEPAQPDLLGSGYRLVIEFHPPVPRPMGTRPERIKVATQACADALSRGILEHPQDWHMLQRVFSADLTDTAGQARGHA